MKGEFPMAADMLLGQVFPAFAVPAPKLARETYTLKQFLDELVAPYPDLQAANVHKRRYGYDVMGCMAEVAEVLVNGARIKTASLESADLDALEAARSRTALDVYENTNYLVALKRVIGMAPLPRDAYYCAV
jgi:exopolyphosphatase/guanosine-5'-triphosphate,3'-diphosphate pyrophosphatase